MPNMSQDGAIALAHDLRNMGITDDGIRSRLTNEGFSYSDASNIINNLPERDGNRIDQLAYKKHTMDDLPQTFKRGKLLTAWLILQVIGACASIVLLTMFPVYIDRSNPLDILIAVLRIVSLIAALVQFVCVFWLWNGKEKGYKGILALYGLAIVTNLVTGQFAAISASLLGLAITVHLVRPKEYLLT